jgi:hypothetical protein
MPLIYAKDLVGQNNVTPSALRVSPLTQHLARSNIWEVFITTNEVK